MSTCLFRTNYIYWLIKWLSTSTISMSILGEPIGTCILAFFILGDTITLKQLIGSMIILFGIFLFLIYNQKATNSEVEDH
ncbi:EamA family transporter [Clostridium sp.]|uniref:EamA family transporter n=1 Tax=Clostridium sp. TaxID=1506 RepID=UPI00261C2FE1|nr:EamA family transporter [Clostridium sp.]